MAACRIGPLCMKRLPSSELPKANAHRPPLQRFFQSLMSSSEGDYEIGIARGSVAAVSDACSATLRERRYRGLVFRRGDGAGLDCFLALSDYSVGRFFDHLFQ